MFYQAYTRPIYKEVLYIVDTVAESLKEKGYKVDSIEIGRTKDSLFRGKVTYYY